MDSRRDFLKKAALLSGAAGLSGVLPPSIQRAMAINPAVGSTFRDAEHVVILMQENRSFDHSYGSLQGVRGFNDPRAITLPDNKRVWLQTNEDGKTFVPFRLNMKDTNATWMGSLPHGWTDQVDARNEGKYDRWLQAKRSGHREYSKMPLTLGYYNREDLPFYYSLADAFTVCDQNFCSSLTGTTPNRLYLWTGMIRDEQKSTSPGRVRNADTDYDAPARWMTFPERLEDHTISWKIYQNELSVDVGFDDEEDGWLANFTDNPIEWFEQYRVKFHPAYRAQLPKRIEQLEHEIEGLEKNGAPLTTEGQGATKDLEKKQALLKTLREEQKTFTAENYARLSQREKNLHEKAFTTNIHDPEYHTLTTLQYKDDQEEREVKVPKGDILYQFREDVKSGKLPIVSWIVAPANFSDHPGSPWYGAWYVSEVMDILTKDPEVWKKTIFILCYDENDGYFDHVPPFVPPNPYKPASGLASEGIDTRLEHITLEDDLKRHSKESARGSSIGLGYRVPLVIASPWSRGGAVNSQVFDHTSILQFLEKFLSHKTGKKIEETNISTWRRTVCGDLTSVFTPYNGEKITLPSFLAKNEFIESIYNAKFKKEPSGFKPLTEAEIEEVNRDPLAAPQVPKQEKGVRISNALPYQLYAHGQLSDDKRSFQLQLKAGNEVFGPNAAGSPFNVYGDKRVGPRAYAVKAGDQLTDAWEIDGFENNHYNLDVYGPNGFFRQFKGSSNDPHVNIICEYERRGKDLTGNVELKIKNTGSNPLIIAVTDNAYKTSAQKKTVAPGTTGTLVLDLSKSYGWYDLTVTIAGHSSFSQRFAGRVETGKSTFSDPFMGQAV